MAEDANTIILAPSRERTFGSVDEVAASCAGISAGDVILKHGVPSARGFGLEHIRSAEARMREIKGVGYNDAITFIYEICQNWTRLLRGKDGKYILVWQTQGKDLCVVIDWRDGAWSITTAMANRVARGELLHERERRAEESEPPRALVGRTRFETLSLPKKT